MNEELQQLLENLKLKTTAARFDAMLAEAEASGTPVSTLLAQLLRAEWHARQEQALQSRIQRAHFKQDWLLESFPFKEQKGSRSARSVRSLNWSSSPRPRTSCSSAKPALAKPA